MSPPTPLDDQRRERRPVWKRVTFPDSLIVVGGLLGASPFGWWLGGFHGLLGAAHVAILVGFLLEPTIRRFWLAAGFTLLVWWPAWLGQWFWD
ncbi:MAG: hypothetical protein F4209_08100 [Chloroflexi bacterium]|nr:hypothetical protein [Chloroflexota bacterium]